MRTRASAPSKTIFNGDPVATALGTDLTAPGACASAPVSSFVLKQFSRALQFLQVLLANRRVLQIQRL
jgi:hypothetical protein